MNITNIYVAKSYQADPDDIIRLNDFMRDYNVKIKSYKGGKYNQEKELNDIVAMFVLPPKLHMEYVGKGLYSQIHYCLSRDTPVFIVTHDIKFLKVETIKVFDSLDWQSYYGQCLIGKYFYNMLDYLPINTEKKYILNFEK